MNVTSLYLCCPATINGCKPLVNRKDLKFYLSWNQDDKIIDISESFKFMDDMNKQSNQYKFYSYPNGGHEINPTFISDLGYQDFYFM
jgi:predicted esterase